MSEDEDDWIALRGFGLKRRSQEISNVVALNDYQFILTQSVKECDNYYRYQTVIYLHIYDTINDKWTESRITCPVRQHL